MAATTRKLWPGAPGSLVEPPSAPAVRDTRDTPEVTINGVRYQWEPGRESGIPPEALRIWRAYLEVND